MLSNKIRTVSEMRSILWRHVIFFLHWSVTDMISECAVYANGACAHYVMVSKFQWKPFWLATQRDPQNDWTATPNRVNYDVVAQAPSPFFIEVLFEFWWMPQTTANTKKIKLRRQFVKWQYSLSVDCLESICLSVCKSVCSCKLEPLMVNTQEWKIHIYKRLWLGCHGNQIEIIKRGQFVVQMCLWVWLHG